MCWCRLISTDKCLIWVQDVDSTGGCDYAENERLYVGNFCTYFKKYNLLYLTERKWKSQ